jgi:hypothetical protein
MSGQGHAALSATPCVLRGERQSSLQDYGPVSGKYQPLPLLPLRYSYVSPLDKNCYTAIKIYNCIYSVFCRNTNNKEINTCILKPHHYMLVCLFQLGPAGKWNQPL